MRKIIFALFASAALANGLLSAAHAATTAEPRPVPSLAAALQVNAPERHVVVPGDTLWGIAAKFLKDPYRWNELFALNKGEIRQPNLIYPGQVLVLDRSSGQPRVLLEEVKLSPKQYVEPIKKPIWTVSPESIEPFLSKPLVIERGGLDGAARVIGIQDNRVVAGAGDHIYAVNVETPARDWQIFRPGAALVDPESSDVLGHEALYLGTARQLTEGVPADFLITTAREELTEGDRLLPAPRLELVNYVPHAPSTAMTGRVVGLAGGVAFGGRNNVISISLGKADGVELGHVLAIDRAGDRVDDRFMGDKTTYQLPDLRNGLIFVFRVFDRVSYGLIMEAIRPVQRGDTVRTP